MKTRDASASKKDHVETEFLKEKQKDIMMSHPARANGIKMIMEGDVALQSGHSLHAPTKAGSH